MSMGKVKVERRQRLLDICKRIVDAPHDVDDDTKARLKTARAEIRKHAAR
jgi:hypothetical protein